MNDLGYVRQNTAYGSGPWHRAAARRAVGQESSNPFYAGPGGHVDPLDAPIDCGGVLSHRVGTGTQSSNTRPTEGTFCPKCFPAGK